MNKQYIPGTYNDQIDNWREAQIKADMQKQKLRARGVLPESKPDPELLEKLSPYPHIKKRIELIWGTVPLDQYLNSLLLDTREGHRQGFPMEVASAIASLAKSNLEYLESIGINPDESDIWSSSHKR